MLYVFVFCFVCFVVVVLLLGPQVRRSKRIAKEIFLWRFESKKQSNLLFYGHIQGKYGSSLNGILWINLIKSLGVILQNKTKQKREGLLKTGNST